ncbi:MAG: ferredoxin family protein [Burkholderiales bacterium]|nr:ferredoxin family protein [Burkholderiales bacterium]
MKADPLASIRITNPSCGEFSGKIAPVIDRNRCEGSGACVQVCPFKVFEIRKLDPQDRSKLSVRGKLRAWAHGGKQAYLANPRDCHTCRLCIDACPETALELGPLAG